MEFEEGPIGPLDEHFVNGESKYVPEFRYVGDGKNVLLKILRFKATTFERAKRLCEEYYRNTRLNQIGKS